MWDETHFSPVEARPPGGEPATPAAGIGPARLFPEPPAPGAVPSCAEAGVLGVLPGVVGAVMAPEAIKLLAGLGEPLLARLQSRAGLRFRMRGPR